MIDLPKIGAYLSHLRKAKDLTQAELAEQLNLSHQAVSKWERGESMPDIGMLPKISSLFGITVDDLLRGEQASQPPQIVDDSSDVKWHAETSQDENRAALDAPVEETVAAPAVTEQAKEVDSVIMEQTITGDTAKGRLQRHDIMKLAPFLGTEMLDELVLQQAETDTMDWKFVKGLAPFLSKGGLDALASKLIAASDTSELRHLIELAPFLGKEKMEELVQQAEAGSLSWDAVRKMAPFIGRETMKRLVGKLAAEGSPEIGHLASFAPFLDKETVEQLVQQAVEGSVSWEVVQKLAPFIGRETIDGLVNRVTDGTLDARRIVNLTPFLSKELLRKLVNDMETDSLTPELLISLAPFIDKETLGGLVKKLHNKTEDAS